ncbi:MAG: histidinol-phosphate transaminase [Alphaproteobacteria bacterium]|nr:histidinol-phosphate transaminase [Alphaproteobacteria bacterium]
MLTVQPHHYILEIKPYVGGKSKAGTKRVIKLSSNENTAGPSPKVMEAMANAGEKLFRYPDGTYLELREAIGGAHGIDPSRVVCGTGSDEIIALLIHSYAGPGAEVLYSQHGFLMYRIYAQSFGATPVSAPEKNLRTDIHSLLAAVTPKTKLVFVANPNNPTGSYISREELHELRAKLRQDVLLVIDAAYAEYVDDPSFSAGDELVAAGNTVVLRTFSKIYGISALRLGWGHCPPAVADVLNRARGPFNVNNIAVACGIAAVKDQEYVRRMREQTIAERGRVAEHLNKLGIIVHPSAANFVLTEFAETGKTAAAANAFLLEQGIIVREVMEYGLPRHLRITIGTRQENDELLKALSDFMAA